MLNAENLLIIHEKAERIRFTHTIISLQKEKNSFVIEIANETYPNRKFCGVHFFFQSKTRTQKDPSPYETLPHNTSNGTPKHIYTFS